MRLRVRDSGCNMGLELPRCIANLWCFTPSEYRSMVEQYVLEHALQTESDLPFGGSDRDTSVHVTRHAGPVDHVHLERCACTNATACAHSSLKCAPEATCLRGCTAFWLRWPPSWGPVLMPIHIENVFQQFYVEQNNNSRLTVYFVALALGVYYWLDSVVFAVHDPSFPELDPSRPSYHVAIASRSI